MVMIGKQKGERQEGLAVYREMPEHVPSVRWRL